MVTELMLLLPGSLGSPVPGSDDAGNLCKRDDMVTELMLLLPGSLGVPAPGSDDAGNLCKRDDMVTELMLLLAGSLGVPAPDSLGAGVLTLGSSGVPALVVLAPLLLQSKLAKPDSISRPLTTMMDSDAVTNTSSVISRNTVPF